jgi:preprotein translocase subunit SecE
MNPAESVKDWSERIKQYYQDVRGEMKKVSWPGRQEIVGTTIVVIVATFFFGAYLGLIDYILSNALAKVLAYFQGRTG